LRGFAHSLFTIPANSSQTFHQPHIGKVEIEPLRQEFISNFARSFRGLDSTHFFPAALQKLASRGVEKNLIIIPNQLFVKKTPSSRNKASHRRSQ
jgi:hypothetical protein